MIFAVGQRSVWGDLLAGASVEFNGPAIVADKLTYQTGQPDVFVGGDVYTGPKFAIDAIAAGHYAAESLHRYVQNGHMTSDATVGSSQSWIRTIFPYRATTTLPVRWRVWILPWMQNPSRMHI